MKTLYQGMIPLTSLSIEHNCIFIPSQIAVSKRNVIHVVILSCLRKNHDLWLNINYTTIDFIVAEI